MNINTKSWHYQLVNYSTILSDTYYWGRMKPYDLCHYMRRMLMGLAFILFAIFTSFVVVFAPWVYMVGHWIFGSGFLHSDEGLTVVLFTFAYFELAALVVVGVAYVHSLVQEPIHKFIDDHESVQPFVEKASEITDTVLKYGYWDKFKETFVYNAFRSFHDKVCIFLTYD